MSEISRITELRKLMRSMERSMGLEAMSDAERDVYLAAHEIGTAQSFVSTSELMEHGLVSDISRPTFFRALKSLVNQGYLSHQTGATKGRYTITKR